MSAYLAFNIAVVYKSVLLRFLFIGINVINTKNYICTVEFFVLTDFWWAEKV